MLLNGSESHELIIPTRLNIRLQKKFVALTSSLRYSGSISGVAFTFLKL